MIFHNPSNRPKSVSFFMNSRVLETVKSFAYLGVIFSSGGRFRDCAEDKLKKSNFAAFKIRSIFENIGLTSSFSRSLLYESSVLSVLLYGSEVWGLEVGDILEKAQVRFFKNLYFLDKSTPGYVVRLEFSIDSVEIPIVSRAINWLCKLLDMDESRYPKICYRRLLYLDSIGICYQNWVSTMRAFFERAGQIGLFHSQSASLIRGSKEIILNALRLSFSRIDYDRAVKSSYCPVYGHLLGHDNWVLGAPMALSRARLLFQLRVQNTRSQTFYWKGRVQRFLPSRFCQLCSLQAPDSFTHLVLSCPNLTRGRLRFLPLLSDRRTESEKMAIILSTKENLGMLLEFVEWAFSFRVSPDPRLEGNNHHAELPM